MRPIRLAPAPALALSLALMTGAGAAATLVAPAVAFAQSAKSLVDQAKAAGVVGEEASGYLGFVSGGGDAALKAAVAEINAGRAAAYRQAAAKTGVTAEAAGQATAQQLLARIPSGQYWRPLSGAWEQR